MDIKLARNVLEIVATRGSQRAAAAARDAQPRSALRQAVAGTALHTLDIVGPARGSGAAESGLLAALPPGEQLADQAAPERDHADDEDRADDDVDP